MPAETARYNDLAKTLHWLILVLLIAQFAIAWTMPEVHRYTEPVGLIAWHLSVGALILLIMLIRLVWRVVTAVPPPPADLPAPLQLLSRATHFLLYMILIVLPVLGWINASSRGWQVWLLGFIPLPALVPSGSAWGHTMGGVHQNVALILLGVAGLHILGAVYHQFVLRDTLLLRMLPGSRRPTHPT